MAQIRWYLNNTTIDGWQLLDQSAATAATLPNGWVVGTGATFSSELASGAAGDRASTTFTANTVPDGTLDTTLKDACRSQFAWTGNFAAGSWTFQFAVVSTVQSGAADGQIVFRILKANADGSGATEITSAQQATTVASNVAGTDVNITATWAAPAWSITNQYIFVQLAWKRTGAGGMTTTNIRLRTGSSTTVGTTGLTANFTESLLTASVFETIAVSELRKPVLRQLAGHEDETVSVAEFCKPVLRQLAVHAAETIGVTESRRPVLQLGVRAADSVGVSDSASVATAGGGGGGPAAITLVISASANGNDGASITDLDLTGVDLIVLIASRYDSGPAYNISDSEGNTYTTAVVKGVTTGFTQTRVSYAWDPTVSASMDFSHPGTDNYATLIVLGFAGVDRTADPLVAVDGLNNYTDSGATPVVVGAIASLAAGDLLVSGVGQYPLNPDDWTTVTLPTSVIAEKDVGVAGATFGASAAYRVNETGSAMTALTPTWTPWNAGVTVCGVVATFRAAAGGPTALTAAVADTIGVLDSTPAVSTGVLLLDTGFRLLLNTGDGLLLAGVAAPPGPPLTVSVADTVAVSDAVSVAAGTPPSGGVELEYDFTTESDEVPLPDPPWQAIVGQLKNLSGQATPVAFGGVQAVRWNPSVNTLSQDQYCEVQIGAGSASAGYQQFVLVRAAGTDAASFTGYVLYWGDGYGAGTATIGHVSGGTFFVLASFTGLTLAPGDWMYLEADGSTLTAWHTLDLLGSVAAPGGYTGQPGFGGFYVGYDNTDRVNLGELGSVGPPTTLTVSVADTISVAEFRKAVEPQLAVHAAEVLTVTELRRAVLPQVAVHAADSVAVAELRTAVLRQLAVHAAETIGVTDFRRAVLPQLAVHAAEALTVTELRKPVLSQLAVHAVETLTVTDFRTAVLAQLAVHAAETVAVTELRKAVLPQLAVHAADAVAVAEFQKAVLPLAVHAAEALTVTDFRTAVLPQLAVHATETIGVTESTKLVFPQVVVRVADAVAVAELRKAVLPQLAVHAAEALSVTEFRTAALGQLAVHAAEIVTVTDFRTAVLPQVAVHAAETITITEAQATRLQPLVIRAVETIGVTDFLTAGAAALNVSVFETLSVTEARATRLQPLVVRPVEPVTVVDSAVAALRTVRLKVSVAEGVSVTDSAKAVLRQLAVHAADALTVAEFRKAVLPQLAVHAVEVLTVAEFRKAALGQLAVRVADSIGVTDAVSAEVRLAVGGRFAAEAVGVTDSAVAALRTIRLSVAVSDSVAVADSTLLGQKLTLARFDAVLVTDSVKVVLPLVVRVADSIGTTDSVRRGLQLGVVRADAIGVTDSAKAVFSPLVARPAESVAVADRSTVVLRPLVVRLADAVGVTDVVRAGAAVLTVDGADAVGVTESAKAVLPQLVVRAADAVGVTESAKAVLPQLVVHAAEALTVEEFSKAVLPELAVHAADALTVEDAPRPVLPELMVAVFETVAVTDREMAAFGVLAVDEVTVTEAVVLVLTPVTHFVSAELRDTGSRSHHYGILVGDDFDGVLVGAAGSGRLVGAGLTGTLVGAVGGRLVRVEN